jgi:hypothetical protein
MIYNLGICSVGTLKSKISFPVYHTNSGVRVTRFLSFVHLTIVLFDLLRFAEFDYSFGIFKLFLQISRDENYIVFSDDSVEMLDI